MDVAGDGHRAPSMAGALDGRQSPGGALEHCSQSRLERVGDRAVPPCGVVEVVAEVEALVVEHLRQVDDPLGAEASLQDPYSLAVGPVRQVDADQRDATRLGDPSHLCEQGDRHADLAFDLSGSIGKRVLDRVGESPVHGSSADELEAGAAPLPVHLVETAEPGRGAVVAPKVVDDEPVDDECHVLLLLEHALQRQQGLAGPPAVGGPVDDPPVGPAPLQQRREALGVLDAMVPAGSRRASTAKDAAAGETTRLVCIEEVHGLAGCNEWGNEQGLFAPSTVGRDFEILPESALSPLIPYQDYLTIVSNTDVRMAEAFTGPEIGGDHFRSSAVFLTQAHPKQTQGSDIYCGTSLDQLYAGRYGQETPMPSMQFCIENLDQAGGCTYNYSCAYTDSISWASPTEPLPMIRDPRVAFDMLFGAGGSPEERIARRRERSSILDWIAGEIAAVRRELGAEDRARMEQYLQNVREIERRIEMIEARNNSGEEREIPEAPAGVPDSFSEHMKLMFDLQVLALETDMTRVISFKTGRDAQNRVFPESGSSRPFHPASHHGGREEAILEFNKICTYRMAQIPYFLDKLQNTTVGGVPLLDQTAIVWGSPMADGNLHNHRRCPLLFLGGANGKLAGNMHVKAPDGTPMANAMLSLMNSLGMDMTGFGDSTGELGLTMPTTVDAGL